MPDTVDELIEKIAHGNAPARTAAWYDAGPLGAAAVAPLAALVKDDVEHEDIEIARAARNALWRIARHAARPGAAAECRAVAAALLPLLDPARPEALRREVVWMLSEIGGAECVPALAGLLADAGLREDARCALERIPEAAAVDALRAALESAPEHFEQHIVQSLRARGVAVEGHPCRKLRPVYPLKRKRTR